MSVFEKNIPIKRGQDQELIQETIVTEKYPLDGREYFL